MTKLVGKIEDSNLQINVKMLAAGPKGEKGEKGEKGDKGDPGEVTQAEFDAHLTDYATYKDSNNLKVAKIEKELNDYKQTMANVNVNQEAKQTATGYGVISLPPNAAEGQISGIKIEGLTATNLINGRGDNLEGWTNITGDLTIEDNFFKYIGGAINKRDSYPIQVRQGDKLYLSYFYKTTGTPNCNHSFRLFLGETLIQIMGLLRATENVNKELTRFSLVFECEGDADNIAFRPYDLTSETGHWYFKHIMLINLTQVFGAGNEPTKEECDQIFANYFDGTKSTFSAMRIKSVGKNLFNKSRASKGFRLNPSDGSQQPVDRPAFCSDFIRVNSNERYYISGLLKKGYSFAAYYDKDKRFIRRDIATPRSLMLISDLQDNEKYIRITVYDIADAPAAWEDINNVLNNLQVEKGSVATAYETYQESNAYVIAKNEQGNVLELRSLPNGTKDEFNVVMGEYIQRIGKHILQESDFTEYRTSYDNIDVVLIKKPLDSYMYGKISAFGTAKLFDDRFQEVNKTFNDSIDFENTITFFAATDRFAICVPKGTYADLATARADLAGKTLIYQLAEPIEMPVQVSGTLIGHPSGTVYIEPYVADAGIYTDKMEVLYSDLPIKALEKISKVDFDTGLETELDITAAVIAEDKLSFTHPDLVDGDIVFFTYEYDRESTEGETEIEYYDSRYVIKDSVTDKFYKWHIAVADGVPSIELAEV